MSFIVKLDEGETISFIDLGQVEEIHSICLMPGNPDGYLKRGDLEGALGRPINHHYYRGECDLVRLAAILWHAISVAHGFIDGNKRTGFLCAFAFLEANGIEIDPSVAAEDPGTFVDACFQQNQFHEEILANYLRSRCRWIV